MFTFTPMFTYQRGGSIATTVVAARIDDAVKRQADMILKSAHVTPTELVRRVYDYIVYLGDVPEFVKCGEFAAPAESEDPVQAAMDDLFAYLDDVFPPEAPRPALTQDDLDRTFAKEGFDETPEA